MLFCTALDLQDYLLEAYLTKIEEIRAGSADRHIANVSAEIDEALLQGGWEAPDDGSSSATLRRICAVMVDWRLVGEITSLMSTGAISDNEWFPLQKLNARAEKDMELIRAGKLDPFPAYEGEIPTGIIEIDAPDQIFTRERWEMF
jgi:hypothetical protein